MHRFQNAVLVSFAAGAIGVVLALAPFGSAIEDQLGLQLLYTIRGPIEAPTEVAVVGIDKRSAGVLGLPTNPGVWPRETHARLIDRLVRRGASVIAFDLDFSEPRDDEVLAAAMARADRVVLFQRIDIEKIPLGRKSQASAGDIVQERILFPTERLRAEAKGLGPFPLPKVPARVDQFWAFKPAAGEVWPTLPAVALQLHTLAALDQFLAHLEQAGIQKRDRLPQGRADVRNERDVRRLMRNLRLQFAQNGELSERLLATLDSGQDGDMSPDRIRIIAALTRLYGRDGDYRINYYGPPGTIPTIPYFAVLNDDLTSDRESQVELSGKVVFVGASELRSADQRDAFYTVFSRDDGVDLSGVEIAATAFANLLNDHSLWRFSNLATFTVVIIFGALVGALAYLLPGMRAVASTLGVGAVYFGSAQFLFVEHNQIVPLVVPLFFQLPAALLMGMFVQYLGASRERDIVSRAIRRYVPENVVETLEKEGVAPEKSELVYGTCLRTDAEHYTTLSEVMEPQELASLMNEYYDLLGAPVIRHKGTIAAFHADSMMCVWSAPHPEKDVRLRACMAALEIRQAVDSFNRRHQGRTLPTRIGLDAGWVAMGHVGGSGRFAYDVTGDTANTASRLEGMNKYLGTTILASETVVADLDGLFLRRMGSFRLEGKSDAVSIFEIIARPKTAANADVDLCKRFAAALNAFESEHWSDAAKRFGAVLSEYPADGPAQFYLERCRQYSLAPPTDDGWIIEMGTK